MLTITFGRKVQFSFALDFYRPTRMDFWPYLIRPAYAMGEQGFRMMGGFGVQFTVSRNEVQEYIYRATDGSAAHFKEMAQPYDAYEIIGKRFERQSS